MAFSQRTHFVMMASYHRWATRRLFAGLSKLDGASTSSLQFPSPPNSVCNPHPLTRDVGLPLGSIYGTLAHLYYADQLWLCRLNGQKPPIALNALWSSEASPFVFAELFNAQHGIPPSVLLPTDDQEAVFSTLQSGNTTLDSLKRLLVPSDDQASTATRAYNLLTMEIDDQMGDLLTITKGYTEQELAQKVKYTTTTEEEFNRTRVVMLTHIFNHATHHRGQITAAMTLMGAECPSLDLTAYLPEWEELHGKAFRWN